MHTWEQYTKEEEASELDRWALGVDMALRSHLDALAWRPRGCFQVTLSSKDADLTPDGCYGIDGIHIGMETASITFAQHWAMQFCEACQEAHTIAEFGPLCDDGEDSNYDDFHEERRESRQYDLPLEIQATGDDSTEEALAAYVALAERILNDCERWSDNA